MYASANRGKRSIALDLSQEDGIAVLKEMVKPLMLLFRTSAQVLLIGWELVQIP